ncbi:hypothetical protein ACJMK2_039322 [Sinanodonta woodiana]|uniref:Sodium-coupled monocarboxylate transporter 1 n=1 Tax=Sinanodonta woodiana TaxID=1069815 RepID=A0ABD3WFK8_SINWO
MNTTIKNPACEKVCLLCDGKLIGEFSVADYVLFGAVLVISAGIGVYYVVKEMLASRKATADDVLMGGRDIGIFPIAMSLMASFMSAITVLGTPTEMYNNNTAYWVAGLAIIPTIITVNHIFLPFFHKMNLTSAYELLYMGVVLYAPSLALNSVTGLSLELSIVAIGVVCTFYTALGGLRAVVWSDTFQTFVVMAGLIAVIVQGAIDLGGIGNVWSIAYHGERIKFLDWNADPTTRHSVWSLIIGSYFGQLTIYAANQTMIQRYLAIKDPKNSQRALYINLPCTIILSTVVCIVGLVSYATYSTCDPFLLGHVKARDQLLPFLVMDKLTRFPGLSGLFVACLFSASLSSISSGLNALAIVILEDICKLVWEYKKFTPGPVYVARLAKILGLVCGAMVIGIAFISQFLGQTVLQIMLSIFGMVGGPLLGLFLEGIFMPFINGAGALTGLIVSAILTFWIGVGGTVILPVPEVTHVNTDSCKFYNNTCVNSFDNTTMSGMQTVRTTTPFPTTTSSLSPEEDLWIYHLSYLWYALFAVIVSLITSILVTIISAYWTDFVDTEDIDPQLIHPWADRICCFLPATCQRVHRFPKQRDIELSEMEHNNKHSYSAPYDVSDDLDKQPTRHRVTYRNGDVQLPVESGLPDGGATKL